MAILGYAATLTHGTPPTAIAKIRRLGGPNLDTELVDVTTFDSPDNFREFIGGLIDAGEFEVELIYTPAGCSAIYGLLRTETDYVLMFSDNATWAFTGFMSRFGQETPLDDAVTMTAGFKITGAPTFTPV